MKPILRNKQPTRLQKLAQVIAIASLALASNTPMAQPESPKGFPDQAYVVPVAGQGVPVREGLESVLPEGWYFYVKPSTLLPSSMNWKAGDNWTSILDSLAHDNGLSVSINWADKGVIIRTADKPADVPTKTAAIVRKPAEVPPIVWASAAVAATTPAVAASSATLAKAPDSSLKAIPASKPDVASQPSTSVAAPRIPTTATRLSVENPEAASPHAAQTSPTRNASPVHSIELLEHSEEHPVFDVKPGQNLRTALTTWLHAQGYSVEWAASQNPVFGVAHHYEGESITEMLGELLLPLGMRAEVYFIGESGKKAVIKPTSSNSN